MTRFRGTTCDQCKAEAKHPGHGLAEGPLTGWLRVTDANDARFDFCSIKCATDWLKERKRRAAERARERARLAKQTPKPQQLMQTIATAGLGKVHR